jgi:hypothetical protein
VREIILSSGDVCLVDDDDYNFVNQWKWKPIKSGKRIYAGRNIRGKNGKKWACVLMHRLLTDAPDGMQVDHIDGDTLNNSRSNLRVCTQSQNQVNSSGQSGSASRYCGVTRNGSGWIARTKKNGVPHRFGTYRTEEEAARAYDAGIIELFGEFAKTNFPVEDYQQKTT